MSWHPSSGLGAWTMQRLSAIYMLLFFFYIILQLSWSHSIDFSSWIAWVSNPLNNVLTGLFTLSLLAHAWVGSRDIILDYIKPFYLRIVKLVVLAFLLIAMGIWAMSILIKVAAL